MENITSNLRRGNGWTVVHLLASRVNDVGYDIGAMRGRSSTSRKSPVNAECPESRERGTLREQSKRTMGESGKVPCPFHGFREPKSE